MIRVMYRWDVTPGKEARFIQLWEEGTRKIQANCRGALGSFLVRSTTNAQHFFGIGGWQDKQAWDEGQEKMQTLGLRGPLPDIIDIFEEVSEIGLKIPT